MQFSGAMLLPVVLLFMGTLFSIFYMAAYVLSRILHVSQADG